MKKVLLTLIALLMSVSLVACGGGSGDDTPVNTAQALIDKDAEIKEKLGFNEYEKLYRAADAITDDLDARYEAFAKADAYMVAKALVITCHMQSISYAVSRVVPFSGPYAVSGIAGGKYKYMQVQEDMVTTEQHAELKAEWEAARSGK